MANRYWVGGTGNWSDDDNHWATSDNGSPADGNIPTSSDDVFFTANAGSGTLTIDGTPSCLSLNFTGSTLLTIAGSAALSIYGNLVAKSGMTWSYSGTMTFFATTMGWTLTSAANSFSGTINFDGVGGGWTLTDNLTSTGEIGHLKGTFDTGGFDISCVALLSSNFSARTLNLNDSIITVSKASAIAFSTQRSNGPLTFDAGTSKIILTGNGGTFRPGDHTYYDVELQNNNNIQPDSITTSWTCNNLTLTPGKTVGLPAAKTTIVNGTFAAPGSLGNVITINSTTGASQSTLSKTSGVVVCDYLNLSDSNATGGATWYAGSNSADTTNNDGWIFNNPINQSNKSNVSTTYYCGHNYDWRVAGTPGAQNRGLNS